jgi:hypothetical protein
MLTFQNGLNFASKQLIDSSSRGSTSTKTLEELYKLIENIAMNCYSWGQQRSRVRTQGMHSINAMASMEAKLEALTKKIEKMNVTPTIAQIMQCDFCGGGHCNIPP